jgi:hypothetical protein
VLEKLARYFVLSARYRRAGPDNPLVQKVAISEMEDLYVETGSERLKRAINRFLCEVKPQRGAG